MSKPLVLVLWGRKDASKTDESHQDVAMMQPEALKQQLEEVFELGSMTTWFQACFGEVGVVDLDLVTAALDTAVGRNRIESVFDGERLKFGMEEVQNAQGRFGWICLRDYDKYLVENSGEQHLVRNMMELVSSGLATIRRIKREQTYGVLFAPMATDTAYIRMQLRDFDSKELITFLRALNLSQNLKVLQYRPSQEHTWEGMLYRKLDAVFGSIHPYFSKEGHAKIVLLQESFPPQVPLEEIIKQPLEYVILCREENTSRYDWAPPGTHHITEEGRLGLKDVDCFLHCKVYRINAELIHM